MPNRTKSLHNNEVVNRILKYRQEARLNRSSFRQSQLKITTKKAGVVPFILNDTQVIVDDIINELRKEGEPIFLNILKSRQVGMSTYVAAKVFEDVYLEDNVNALVMAHLDKRTEALFKTYEDFYERLDPRIKLPTKYRNRKQLFFRETNSGLSVQTAGTESAGRGGVLQKWHKSECAFYMDLEGILNAYNPSLAHYPGGLYIMETTPNGTNNYHYDFWNATNQGETAYTNVFLKWFDDRNCALPFKDERQKDGFMKHIVRPNDDLMMRMQAYSLTPEQLQFYYQTMKQVFSGNSLLMMQEFPCNEEEGFLASGSPLFPMEMCNSYYHMAEQNPGRMFDPLIPWADLDDLKARAVNRKLIKNHDSYMELWEEPKEGQEYVIAVDPALGLEGSDFSCAYIMHVETMNLVGTIHGRISPTPFAKMLVNAAVMYNNAYITPETDGAGAALLEVLQSKYHRIWKWRLIKAGGGYEVTNRPGWQTNVHTRPMMLNRALEMFLARINDPYFIPDKMLIHELRTFVHQGVDLKPAASAGCHDDRVLAWMIGIMCCLQLLHGSGRTALIKESSETYSMDPNKHISPKSVRKNILKNILGVKEIADYGSQY